MGSAICKGDGLKLVKTSSMSRVELCIDIPEWLLMEALIRLPVKQVFKSKLVSKQWLSIISDPYFIQMYVWRASLSPQPQIWKFLSRTMYDYAHEYSMFSEYETLYDVNYPDVKRPSLFTLRCPTTEQLYGEKYEIVGVSNGLLLCVLRGNVGLHRIYNICNPVTGQCISLPPHARIFKNETNGFIAHLKNETNGFVTHVENGILSSYRVVRILERTYFVRLEVFVSEIKEWKDFHVGTEKGIEFTRRRPTTLNRILYWVTIKHGIMAYDPYLKPDSTRFIPLPLDIDHERIDIFSLCDAYQGHLRYFQVYNMPLDRLSSFGVWILNDYISGDWCLQHRIDYADILYDKVLFGIRLFLFPVSFHPFDPEIVYLQYRDSILSYNMKTRKLVAHGRVFHNHDYSSLWTSVTFVIPPWPVSISPASYGVS